MKDDLWDSELVHPPPEPEQPIQLLTPHPHPPLHPHPQNDPLGPSDIHLPLDEQISRFAMEVQKKPSGANPSPTKVRGHSGADSTGPPSPTSTGMVRRDSTTSFRRRSRSGDDDSDSDPDDERTRERQGRLMASVDSAAAAAAAGLSGRTVWTAPATAGGKQPKVLLQGWLNKKATGEGFFGRRNWAPRYGKLVMGTPPVAEGEAPGPKGKDVPMLLLYWFEASLSPSSFIVLDECIVVPVERKQSEGLLMVEEVHKHCLDVVHLPAKRVTRSFSAIDAAERDEWVSKINLLLNHGGGTESPKAAQKGGFEEGGRELGK